MKLLGVAAFGMGYVLGTKAGRERYEQIRWAAAKASARLENYGETRRTADPGDDNSRSSRSSPGR